ncbi:chemotaxis response regulator protein-glutamate methylesterase [bacterium]|nr:chemotaxis response regulator protein-glutamate methylesterase [bacterium]
MKKQSSAKKRVLVVDDSVFARKITTDILSASPNLDVVGFAVNGLDALKKIKELKPDVVTLDIEMPKLNGIETLRRIMQECPTPVLMLSSLTTQGATESVQALRYGAVDVMAKPNSSLGLGMSMLAEDLVAKVLAAADVEVSHLSLVEQAPSHPRVQTSRPAITKFPIVMIASSTGGPRALRTLIPDLTDSDGVAYVIVQHLPPGFTGPFARDLDTQTILNVRESAEGDTIKPGDVMFAKSGFHTVFDKRGIVHITSDPPLWGVRPSADVTMASAVPVFHDRLIGVVLTGMGRDGANGLKLIKDAGGVTLGEHESSCVVYGMPRAAAEMGVVDKVVPLQEMAEAIFDTVLKVAQSHR